MKPIVRQNLSALGLVAIIALIGSGAISTVFTLRDEQANLAALMAQNQALETRALRIPPNSPSAFDGSPFIEAATITLAGAVLQQRVENAVTAAGGRLASSRVDVGGSGDKKRVALEAELTIAQPAMQKLLYDLEAGRPYLFVEAFEARAPEEADAQDQRPMHVSFTLSGQWDSPK